MQGADINSIQTFKDVIGDFEESWQALVTDYPGLEETIETIATYPQLCNEMFFDDVTEQEYHTRLKLAVLLLSESVGDQKLFELLERFPEASILPVVRTLEKAIHGDCLSGPFVLPCMMAVAGDMALHIQPSDTQQGLRKAFELLGVTQDRQDVLMRTFYLLPPTIH